jgi:predicted signal transduction protein with EAL and GGDEF domain
MRILLAEDDPLSRHLLQRMLERSGFEVVCVEDGDRALECLQGCDAPRMAILDWVMPGKDGPSVCHAVRASTTIPYVYMILLTSKESSGDVVTGLESGADDYMIKPSNPEEMRARIRAGQRILELQDRLTSEAHRDALTSLPNRSFFVKRLTESVQRSRTRDGYHFVVLFVDIDRFKTINDSLGHQAGDDLMRGVAQRLLQAVRTEETLCPETEHRVRCGRPSDVVARIGGDEFVVLLDDFADVRDGVRVAERIQKVLETPFLLDGQEVVITASIGISTSGESANDASEILRGADMAMYRAKMLGKARYEVNDPEGQRIATELFKLENDLRGALENQELLLHYQPLVDLRDLRIVGFEVLVRWLHPRLGMMQPTSFIAMAEETGMIVPLGAWVLEEACRQMQEWKMGLSECRGLAVCVNISPRQFAQDNLLDRVRAVLAKTGLRPECLELEMTESLTMKDAPRAVEILHALADLGVSLSVDDFGTGYSSLSYLHRFPLRTLKIDRSFIAEIEHGRERREIVQTIIALGHNLGMRVVAEGVENLAQMELLKTLGCDLGQGFLFSRPVAADQAMDLVRGWLPERWLQERKGIAA